MVHSTMALFFEKGSPTKEIWYFEHPYPEGVKNYNKTRPIDIREFDLEKAWWHKRVENEYAWKVPVEEIVKRGYNLDVKNPRVRAESLGDVDVILPKYEARKLQIGHLQQKIANTLSEDLSDLFKNIRFEKTISQHHHKQCSVKRG